MQDSFQLISTLLGVVVGFVLSTLQTNRRDSEAKKERALSLHSVVSAEIDFNLTMLQEFWNRLTERDSDKEIPNAGEAMSRKLAYLSTPKWSHKLWENQITLLVGTIDKETINKVLRFHQQIDRLTNLQARVVELVKLHPPQYPQYLSSDSSASVKWEPTDFQKVAIPIWNEFFQVTQDLLRIGNPLLR